MTLLSRRRALLASAALAAASPLGAQGPFTFDLFAARKEASTAPVFGGISLGRYAGLLGVRLSGALHHGEIAGAGADPGGVQYDPRCYGYRCGRRRYPYGSAFGGFDGTGFGGWAGDADLVVAPFRPASARRSLLLGFSPYGFVGLGGYGLSRGVRPDSTVGTWSYGAGLQHELLGGVGLAGEARVRQPLGASTYASADLRQNVDYRAGLTVSFGGGHARAAVPRRATRSELSPVVPQPAPVTTDCRTSDCALDRPSSDRAQARFAARVLDQADDLEGSAYTAYGRLPATGFDDVGFVRYVFGHEGVRLPRTLDALQQAGLGVPTRIGSPRPGDLVFFASDGTDADDVGIYVGRDRVIHAVPERGVVYEVLGEGVRGRWLAAHLVSVRRVSPASHFDSQGDDDLDASPTDVRHHRGAP